MVGYRSLFYQKNQKMKKKIMHIIKSGLLCTMLFVAQATVAQELDKQFQILPEPQEVQIISSKGLYGHELSFIVTEDKSELPILGQNLDRLPRYEKKGAKGVYLKLSKQDTPDSPEGYKLVVNKSGVHISSSSPAGLFYGCQTLEQLVEDSKNHNIEIPEIKINDYPDIDYRAIHLDTKHHLDRIEYYYSMIDKLASYKINAIIWEIEDKLRFTRRPEVGAPNAISKQEMQAISRYAKERNIEINPLVQGLGHVGFILKHHWELRENPDSDWEFCPADPRTYDLQFDLYKDALEAMPYARYLHIGGDEITEIGIDERCKATGKTAFELQMQWLKKVCDFAIENGKTPIFWDDMPLKYGDLWGYLHRGYSDEKVKAEWNTSKLDEAIELFPRECVYMRWHYEDPTILAHRMLLDWYQNKGLKVMAATAASYGESPFMPRHNSRAQVIKDFSSLVKKNKLDGILATAWDDGSPHLETVMRGFIAQGEYGWHPDGRTVEEFITAHAQREFGLTRAQMTFLDNLEEAAFFFDKALVVSGRRNPSWQVTKTFELVALPNKDSLGLWSQKYKGKLDSAKVEAKRMIKINEGIDQAKKYATGNRYTLEIYEQTAHLFNYPTQLLLSLEKYDNVTNDADRKAALAELNQLCNDFKTMRTDIENVYSKTRFMQNPEGYIADHNHHSHLSALSNNSDWMYLYEIPMIKKIREWVSSQK